MYTAGVQLAQGHVAESMYSDIAPDKAYLNYVYNGTAAGMLGIPPDFATSGPNTVLGTGSGRGGGGGGASAAGRGDGHTFSYERWVASGTQRRVTGDFLLGHHQSNAPSTTAAALGAASGPL
jgi:hypothetical protein